MVATPNNDPLFIGRKTHWKVELTNQVLARGGGAITSTTPALLGTAGDNGNIITSVAVESTGIVAANVCVLFSLQSGDTAVTLRGEVALPAAASASTIAIITGYPVKFVLYDSEPFEAGTANFLVLEPGESLYAALLVAEVTSKFIVRATGGTYDRQ